MRLLFKLPIILLAAIYLTACGEEEYVFPNLITEMSCLKTDSEGFGSQIITDDGMVWQLQANNRPDSLTADSLYPYVVKTVRIKHHSRYLGTRPTGCGIKVRIFSEGGGYLDLRIQRKKNRKYTSEINYVFKI